MPLYKKEHKFLKIDTDTDASMRDGTTACVLMNLEAYLDENKLTLKSSAGLSIVSLQNSYVLGDASIANKTYVFCTQSSHDPSRPQDYILEFKTVGTNTYVTYIKGDSWGFDVNYPIQAEVTEVNNRIKLYWIDGLHQLRTTFVDDSDTDVDAIVPYKIKGIIAESYSTPVLENCVTRYTVKYRQKYGMTSTNAGFTEPVQIYRLSTGKNTGAKVTILALDSSTKFTNFEIIRLKWVGLESAPIISVVAKSNAVSTDFTFIDNGVSKLYDISLEEMLFDKSIHVIPNAMISKKTNLLLGNIESIDYKLPQDIQDGLRLFRRNNVMDCIVGDPVQGGLNFTDSTTDEYDFTTTAEYVRIGFQGDTPTGSNPYCDDDDNTDELPQYTSSIDLYSENETMSLRFHYDSARVNCSDCHSSGFDYCTTYISATYLNTSGVEITVSETLSYDDAPSVVKTIELTDIQGANTKVTVTVDMVLDAPQSSIYGKLVSEVNYNNPTISFKMNGSSTVSLIGKKITDYTFSDLLSSELKLSGYTASGGYKTYIFNDDNIGVYIDDTQENVDGSMDVFFHTETIVKNIDIATSFTAVLQYTSIDGIATYYENSAGKIGLRQSNSTTVDYFCYPYEVPSDHDAINADNDEYIYTDTGSIGASNEYFDIEFSEVPAEEYGPYKLDFKSFETYRLGIVCTNEYGVDSPAYWMCDLYMGRQHKTGSASESYINRLNIKIKKQIPGVESFRVVKVDRKYGKTRLSQGVLQSIFSWGNTAPGGNKEYTHHFTPYTWRFNGGVANVDGDSVFRIDRSEYRKDFGSSLSTELFSHLDVTNNNIYSFFSPDLRLNGSAMIADKIAFIESHTFNPTNTYIEYKDENGGMHSNVYTGAITNFSSKAGIPSDEGECMYDDFADESRAISAVHYFDTESVTMLAYGEESDIFNLKYSSLNSVNIVDSLAISNKIALNNFAGLASSTKKSRADFMLTDNIVFESSDNLVFSWGFDGITIVDLKVDLPNQYGGDTYESKQDNVYIDASNHILNEVGVKSDLYGDIYFVKINYPKTAENSSFFQDKTNHYSSVIKVSLELEVVPEGFTRYEYFTQDSTKSKILLGIDINKILNYDNSFTVSPGIIQSIASGFEMLSIGKLNNSIIASNNKKETDYYDSWLTFNTMDMLNIEGKYGSIVKLVRFNNEVYAFQESGVAHISVYPIKQVDTMVIGEGSVLDNYKYILENVGIQSIHSIGISNKDIYFIDSITGSLNSMKVPNMHVLLNIQEYVKGAYNSSFNDNDVTSIYKNRIFVDKIKSQIYFLSDEKCIVFDENVKAFTHQRSLNLYPMFVVANSAIFPIDMKFITKLGAVEEPIYPYWGHSTHREASELSLITDEAPGSTKIYDAVEMDITEGADDILTKSGVVLDDDDNVLHTTAPVLKSKYNKYTMHLPRIGRRSRLRGDKIKLSLTFNYDYIIKIVKFFIKFTIKK